MLSEKKMNVNGLKTLTK